MRTEWEKWEEVSELPDYHFAYATTGSVSFPGLDEYVCTGFSEGPGTLDTWTCNYCGSRHWIEDRGLQCTKCGAPRDA